MNFVKKVVVVVGGRYHYRLPRPAPNNRPVVRSPSMMPSQRRLDAVARHVLGGGTTLTPHRAASGEAFAVVEESYEDSLGRSVRVMQLRNNSSGELAEVLLNTPGGQNRSTGSGSVGGLLLRTARGELREVLPHRQPYVGGLMAPFANRIRHGSYSFGGQQHQLTKNWSEAETRMTTNGEHAIHGLLPTELDLVSWQSTEASAQLTLAASFDGSDPGYPFTINVAFTYTLDASGFSIGVSATNASEAGEAAPFMVGWVSPATVWPRHLTQNNAAA